MTKKVGRNDPCPCGSGKKYKNCHMKLEQEQQAAAKYTAAGKRKFKAKVLSVDAKSLAAFDRSATVQSIPERSETLERLKFKQTEKDFRKQEGEKPLKYEGAEENPEEKERHLPKADEEFRPTTGDFRKKK